LGTSASGRSTKLSRLTKGLHNGPLVDAIGQTVGAHEGGALPFAIRAFAAELDLELASFAGLEAQVAAISDDIAYDCHDLEDGLRAGLLSLAHLEELPLVGSSLEGIRGEFPGIEETRQIHELVRRTITAMIMDVLTETLRRVGEAGIASVEDARRAGKPLVGFSEAFAVSEARLKRFLTGNLYRSEAVLRSVRLAETVVLDLFEAFANDPAQMPDEWGRGLDPHDAFAIARRVADYVAGMTDRYAISEHQRLFDDTPDLR
jgi:dGTPase